MAPNVRLAVLPDVYDSAVLRKKLAYRMVTSYAAVLTERNDDFILELGFWVQWESPSCPLCKIFLRPRMAPSVLPLRI